MTAIGWQVTNIIPQPDPQLTPEQQALVTELSEDEIKEIDAQLLALVSNQWRKIAAVVGFTMRNFEPRVFGIPDIFYAQRVRKLVEDSQIESQGNTEYIGYSEVRLQKNSATSK